MYSKKLIFVFFSICLLYTEHKNNDVVEEDDDSFNDSDYIMHKNDDFLFEKNVTDDIELDIRTWMVSVKDDRIELDSLEYGHSDDLQSVHSDSEEEVIRYLKFNAETSMMDPELDVGLRFRSREEFELTVKNSNINNRFEVILWLMTKRESKLVAKKNLVHGEFVFGID
ncbi:Uncharacterized protein Adt_41662 [Abeliophyllum distichum]|uniref:Uncharacterized protein n=1 Tax=Abeliophyllum distichum TaxID=126358 RepID=A0ABD1PPG7_9LAMI